MVGKKISPVLLGMLCFFVFTVNGGGFLKEANSAESLTAKTTLTVVNVTEFLEEATKSPSEIIDYDVTVDLNYVNYVPGWVYFKTKPYPRTWPRGSTSLTGRIWVIAPTNGGKSYSALAWDYIDNITTQKHRGPTVPTSWIGTMLSSLCHTGSTCVATERTNIMFWP